MSSIIAPAPEQPAPNPAGPRMRVLWRVGGSVVVAALLVMGVYQIVETLAHEEHTQEWQFDAVGLTGIEVRNMAGGPVRIVGTDTDTIQVRAHISEGLRRTGHRERIEDGRLLLDSTCPILGYTFCRVGYTIEAPSNFDVLIRSDNGRVTASDITGHVDVRSDSGHVELAQVGGSIRAHSDSASIDATRLTASHVDLSADSGGIYADFQRVPQAVQAQADSGSVEVVLPEGDEAYAVDSHVDSGSESIQVMTNPASARTVVVRADSGNVTVRYRTG